MSDYQLPDAIERARRHALDTDIDGVIDALSEARDEKQALTSAALAMRHEAARNAHRIQELERKLRSLGAEVPSATSTPRGSAMSSSPQASPQPIGPPRGADCGTQTAAHPEFVATGAESSAASTDEQPAAQSSARGFSSTFVRGTPTSLRQSRGGTPNTQRERTFGAPSSQNSLRGQSAPPDPWATLGESASQVAAASGRASPNTNSFRGGGRAANTFARPEAAAQPRPHRPAGIRRPVDASAATQHRDAPPRHHGSPLRRPSSGPVESRGFEALRVVLDEFGASLALGSTCVVATLVLYKLLLR